LKALILTVALACFSVGVFAAEQPAETAAAAQELFRDANEARAKAGVPALEWNQWLAQAARKHGEIMAMRKELSHQFPNEPGLRERLIATDLRFDASAENVAFGETAAEIHDGWMNSAGHRTNLLNPHYNAVGIVVFRRGDILWAVEDFAHTVPQLSATEVENAVGAALDRLRAGNNLARMKRRDAPQLRRVACEMAQRDQVKGAAAFSAADYLKSGVAFTEADPKRFEMQLEKNKKALEFNNYAVGACFARTATYPEGTNFVLVGFF
jgi:hypothetical protein